MYGLSHTIKKKTNPLWVLTVRKTYLVTIPINLLLLIKCKVHVTKLKTDTRVSSQTRESVQSSEGPGITLAWASILLLKKGPKLRFPGRQCDENFALATRISQLVASGRLTITGHDNYTNNNFNFQPN